MEVVMMPYIEMMALTHCARSVQEMCGMSKHDGLMHIIGWLKKHGCNGPFKYMCVASSIPARVAFSRGIRIFQACLALQG